jgi:hypothetical protein
VAGIFPSLVAISSLYSIVVLTLRDESKAMTKQELKDLWDSKIYKVWVVNLWGTGRKSKATDKLVVRARTKEKALLCAKRNSLLFYNKKCSGNARYADPIVDLHCTEVEPVSSPQ